MSSDLCPNRSWALKKKTGPLSTTRSSKRKFFPSALNVLGRPCLVIGGDKEAKQKAARLAESGARVQLKRVFRPADLTNQFFVLLCIKDNPALTKKVAHLCRKKKILLCALDQPDFCDVVNVSFYERGPLKIMISTDGVAPALSKKIRQGLEQSLRRVPLEKIMSELALLRKTLERNEPDLNERRKKLIDAVKYFQFKAGIKFRKNPHSPKRRNLV